MRKKIIFFSDRGKIIANKLNRAYEEHGIEPAECATDGTSPDDFAREGFFEKCALMFIGACGIAVRAVSPYVKDKLTDSPVIVIDDTASFVIPILSGHAQGANKIAAVIAKLLGAVPVITTSTDVNSAFSADVFAREKRLNIMNREGIKKVSAKAIENKRVTISVKDYPPAHKVDIIVADNTDREYDLLLSPKRYTLGIGMKKGRQAEELEEFILSVLSDNNIATDDVYAVATVDIKENDPALSAFAGKYDLPLITFEPALLKRMQGDFSESEFVENTVGVGNICERSAVLAAGDRGQLVVKKTAHNGMTVAVASRSDRFGKD